MPLQKKLLQSNRWPNTNWELYVDAPTLRLDDMKRLVTPQLYAMHVTFIKSMQVRHLPLFCIFQI